MRGDHLLRPRPTTLGGIGVTGLRADEPLMVASYGQFVCECPCHKGASVNHCGEPCCFANMPGETQARTTPPASAPATTSTETKLPEDPQILIAAGTVASVREAWSGRKFASLDDLILMLTKSELETTSTVGKQTLRLVRERLESFNSR